MRISVAGFKGGTAKTTTAVHLAAYLAEDASTLLIDSDPNASALEWSQRGRLPFDVRTEQEAAAIAGRYRHLVFDTEARPSAEDLAALARRTDLLILPSSPDALDLAALVKTIRALRHAAPGRYRVLLTRVPPRPSREGEEARAQLENAGVPIFRSTIRRAVAFNKAALAGVLVGQVQDPRAAAAWEDYRTAGEELTK